MRRYTLRQLDTFLDVARELSISRAAENLHVTQPAVSMQMRQLEEAIGLPLYEQTGRKIKLTDAGEDFQQYAIGAVAQLKQLEDAMAERRGLKKGRVALAIVSTAKYFVPMLLVLFRKKFPDVQVVLHIHNRESIMNLLARNEIDLVIMGRAPDSIDCTANIFATNPLAVISAPQHPLSRRRNAPISILKDHEFVVREKGSGTRQLMERLFAENNIKPPIVMEMPSNETIKQAVMAGMGLSFLSLRTIRHELASGHLVLLDIEGLPIIRHWHVTHLTSKRLSPAASVLKTFLIEEAAPLINLWA
ncbi:LysR family transcriptional regulator [Glaciimonas immobilis]|uniref:DNA-binding transcriptional LysR family regulator n=1 Tax=Glaciimonas immobilis TaxID=728004 RepID=A0A840RYN7_9BURK|nr:LysR family transcriptional regulator [Glaciimonas immobilis]KAF3998669.1 LysR family transcriptional regulator [Glaciimonas immobilis]MBB5201540.1 DNA-binding transcriptional LysR family regulator [Glaciimonas immobilis]